VHELCVRSDNQIKHAARICGPAPGRWPKIKGQDVLKHLMTEHDMTGADLSRNLGGSPNLGAMILRGDRNLTVAHIRKLAAYFKVEPEVFL
jgi:HTH-type transcriptional regulator/antitoxin HigA